MSLIELRQVPAGSASAPRAGEGGVEANAVAFRAAYLEGEPPWGGDWPVAAIGPHGLQRGLEVSLRHADGRELRVLVEPKSSFPCLVATRRLNMSHGSLPEGLAGVDAAAVLQAFAAHLDAREDQVTQADVEAMFRKTAVVSREVAAVEIRINRECNERCLFCNTPEGFDRILGSVDEVNRAIDQAYELGHRKVTFTGREPTLDKNLRSYLERARERGFRRVGLQTNATAFASRAYLDQLVEAGLNVVQVSFHTFDPAVFEELIGPARLLEKTLAGLDNLAEVKQVEISLLVVITTLNVDEMPALADRLAERYKRRVREMIFSPMAPVGDGAARLDLLPRLSEIGERLAPALERARAAGMRPAIPSRCGLPLCVTPPAQRSFNLESLNAPGDNVHQGKSKPASCSACRYDRVCGGIWDEYRATQGDAYLMPVPSGG
jgi:MoaA/NifB/PqqE/SkfB family radical SAM enzyme